MTEAEDGICCFGEERKHLVRFKYGRDGQELKLNRSAKEGRDVVEVEVDAYVSCIDPV